MSQDTFEQGTDAVDEIMAAWQRERPDLDPSAKALTGRIIRLASLFQEANARSHEESGLNGSDYGILAPLRRAGPPFRLTPTDLAKQRMMTSGGMTSAIDRLERKGLVARRANPADRRGSLVELTEEGRQVIDQAMAGHVEVEHRMVEGLEPGERAQLEGLLRKLLLSVERP